jgi:hypothetical protein
MSVELTVKDVERWKDTAERAIDEGSSLEPVERWPAIVIALIEGCYQADAQCRRLRRMLDKCELELAARRGDDGLPAHVLAQMDAALPYIERDRKKA